MKILTLSLLITFFGTLCNDKFEIIEATSQEWAGGRQETGRGIMYEFTIVTKINSDALRFDQLWIGEKYFEISCYQKGKRVKNDTFGPGDTVTISVNYRLKNNDLINENLDKADGIAVPKKYTGDALLSYILNGDRKYKVIEKITKLEPLKYP